MIADSVAFLAGEGKRVIYDAEHFFDAFAEDPAYALRCLRAAVEAGACDRRLLRHQRRHAAGRHRRRHAPTSSAELGSAGATIGIHCHDDAGCGVANSLAAVDRRSHARAGHDQRLRRALRQRQPRLDHPQPAAQAGRALPRRHAAGRADRHRPLRGRAAELHARSRRSPTSGRNAFAHKGGMHVAGVNADPGHLRAHRARDGRQPPRDAHLRALGQGHGAQPGPGGGDRARATRPRPR